jgi:hypothetical protein
MRLYPVDVRMTRLPRLPIFASFIVALAIVSDGGSIPRSAAAASLEASTSRASRDEAIAMIPFDQLTDEVQAKLRSVVTSPTLYRRMPVKSVECDPELYLFMVRYPEVVVNIWELMGLTNITIDRTGPYKFRAVDGSGASGDIDLVYGNQRLHVYFIDAEYSGSMFKRKLVGRCVLVLTSDYGRTSEGRDEVTSRLDLFLQLDNVGAELLAKTLQPIVGKSADHNFVETAGFLGRVSAAAETNGFGIQQLSHRLTNVPPEVRTEFSRIAGRVSGLEPRLRGPLADPSAVSELARLRIEPPTRLRTTAVPASSAIDVAVDTGAVEPMPTTTPIRVGPLGPRKAMLLKR